MVARLSSSTSASPATGSDREPPRTPKGERTRAELVAAARTVFERDGYLDTRLTDITKEADKSAGSFYTYFTGKEDIFSAVLEDVKEEMLHPHIGNVADDATPVAMIDAANRAYLDVYRRNAKLMQLLEQVSTIDEHVREFRRQRAAAFAERNARSIRDLQARGLADPDLSPLTTAKALSAMVGRMAYTAYVLEDGWDIEELSVTLTKLWVNALKIPEDCRATKARGCEGPSRN
jgi:AcrR family transcriptional regulator